jgi:flagellar basal-body rod protein FlgF
MIYGLYLSATGVMASSYRQDVISNNLANAETVGFKRDLATFEERRVESQTGGGADPRWRNLTGGLWASATALDSSQGELESTGNSTDVAIEGSGYFQVKGKGESRLTRDGRFMIDKAGNLIMANGKGEKVLDPKGKPIVLDGRFKTEIASDGAITQQGKPVGSIGVFDVPQPQLLKQEGGSLLAYPKMSEAQVTDAAKLRSGFVERANVDPASELVQLMDAQRQLEANANMIKFQDMTMGRLVNDVAKIS